MGQPFSIWSDIKTTDMKTYQYQIIRTHSPPCNVLVNFAVIYTKLKTMKQYLIILFFLFFSCKKEALQYNVPCNLPTYNIDASKALVIGKWEWASELYRVPFTTQYILKTPQSEGYTRQLTAYRDVLEFYKNNTFEQKFLYDFVVESSITNYPDDSLGVLVFKDYNSGIRTNYTHFKICNDTLILNFQVRSETKGIDKWAKIK